MNAKEELDLEERKTIRKVEKTFLVWDGKLLRRTNSVLFLVATQASRPGILKAFNDDIGH